MTKTLVNLTIPVVTQELERILETYPHHPHQEAFANPDIRQSLIAYILNRIPSHYVTLEEEEKRTLMCPESWRDSLEKTRQIEPIIHEGIETILCEQAEDINRHIPDVVNPALAASDWFG